MTIQFFNLILLTLFLDRFTFSACFLKVKPTHMNNLLLLLLLAINISVMVFFSRKKSLSLNQWKIYKRREKDWKIWKLKLKFNIIISHNHLLLLMHFVINRLIRFPGFSFSFFFWFCNQSLFIGNLFKKILLRKSINFSRKFLQIWLEIMSQKSLFGKECFAKFFFSLKKPLSISTKYSNHTTHTHTRYSHPHNLNILFTKTRKQKISFQKTNYDDEYFENKKCFAVVNVSHRQKQNKNSKKI